MSSPSEDNADKDKTETVCHEESSPEAAQGDDGHHLEGLAEDQEGSSSTSTNLTKDSTSVKDARKARLDRLKELHLRRVRMVSFNLKAHLNEYRMKPVSLTMLRWLKKTRETSYQPIGKLEGGRLNGNYRRKRQKR